MGSAVFFCFCFFFCLNRHVALGDKIWCSHGVHSHAALPTAELHLKTLVLLSLPRSLPKQLETREKSGGGSFCLSFSFPFSTCPFPSVKLSSLLPSPRPCVVPTSATSLHRWREAFVANVPPTLHIPRSYRIPHAGGSASLSLSLPLSLRPLSHRWQRSATCVGAGGAAGQGNNVSVCVWGQ